MVDWRQETVDTYNKSAKELADYFRGIGSRVEDVEEAFRLAGNPNSANALEIGCGDGRDAKEIIKRTPNYTGFDISSELIKLAQKHVPNARFEVADLANYAFPQDLDIVFAFASLLHSDKTEVKNVLAKVYQALNIGGIFYISLKYMPEYTNRIKEDKYGRRKFYFYNPQLMLELAGENFEVVFGDSQTLGHTDWFTIAFQKKV